MKRKLSLKTMLVAAAMLAGATSAWAVDVPTPVYFNSFTSTAGLSIKGSGKFVADSDPHFGNVFSNAASTAPRTNYLLLPSTVFSAFTADGGKNAMTISFWVNAKNAGGASAYTYAPLFAAYSAAPTDVTENEVVTGTQNTLPMICLQSRGLIQINNAGWCDFGPALNKDGKNNIYNTNAWEVENTTEYTSGGNWFDDNNWHLYTLTLTTTQATVYLDGVLKNQWNLDGTTDGQIINGMFTASATNLTYVCLGGNQAWGLGDNDAAFMFDDFAVYDEALSAEQIAQIMSDKTTTADITSLTAKYTFNASSTINPFDNGAIWHGTNVDAFLPSMDSGTRGLTATAYFDSNTETDGKQAFTIPSEEIVTISMIMYNGYNGAQDNNATSYSVYNSDGTVLASFTYNSMSCNFTDVKLGGTTVEGFEAFSGQSSYNGSQGANGINDASKPFVATNGYNPVITISMAGDGNVSINFVREKNTAYDKTFSATLSDVKMDLSKIVMESSNYGKGGTNNGNRISGIGYMNIELKHPVTVRAVDGSGNELATIGTFNVNDGETINFAYPRYVLNGSTVYKKDKQSNNEYRITSAAITAAQNIDVAYSQYSTYGHFYTEAEALNGATVATNSGAWTRSSMSALAYGNDIAVTTLPAGTYMATIGWYGKKGETCTLKAGETIIVSATQTGSWGETKGVPFTLTEPTDITMTATGNNYTGIDYILIENAYISATIPSSGFGTIASAYALDCSKLPDGVTAYKVTEVTSTAVKLAAVTEAVAAETGLILNGTAGTYSIPVAATGTDISATNKLKGAVEATVLADGTFYILKDRKFWKVSGTATEADRTMPAGKAYLLAKDVPPASGARSLVFEFGDEATGISAVAREVSNGEFYNLQGQRVSAPKKGLYIVNGKKVVVK